MYDLPRLRLPTIPKDYMMADTFYERLENQVSKAQKELKPDEALAVLFAGPGGEKIQVDDIGYQNPNTIILYGKDADANKCRVVAHMYSVVLICKAMKRTDSAPKRIGFLGGQNEEKDGTSK